MFFELCDLEGRSWLGRARSAAALGCTPVAMPPACQLVSLWQQPAGSACVPHKDHFMLGSCSPASSSLSPLLVSVGCVHLVSFPNSPVGTAEAVGLQVTQLNPWFASFLPLIKGNAKQVWLLTWRGCNSQLTPLPATCLSNRR